MTAAAPRKAAARPARARPTVEVETRVSRVVVPKLEEWLGELEEAAARVVSAPDPEAIHDLRVALRRIRSLLRLVRPVFGRFHVDHVRAELGQIAHASGNLRDEEVLRETIAALALHPALGSGMTKWKSQRAQRERALRTSMVRRVAAGVLVAPVEHLRALLRLPCDTERDEEVRAFARKVVLDAQSEVEQCRQAEVADVAGMHMLRIAHKRLRYAVEAFSGVLPPELRAWKDVASRFQTVLGDLHDHDVATEVAQRATVMAPEVREGLLAALAAKREQIGRTYLELVGQGLAEPEHET